LNPGSHAPQACILVHQPKKFPRIEGFLGKLDDDPALNEYADRIINTIRHVTAKGLSQNTIYHLKYALKRLNRETDLMNPEAVKLYVANLKISNQSKQKFLNNYDYFCKANGLEWAKPSYDWDAKIPIIPSKEYVESIIAAATMKTATIFTLLAETALEGAELRNIKRKDIDAEQGIITANRRNAQNIPKQVHQ